MYGIPNPLLCKPCLTEKLWIITFINDENVDEKNVENVEKNVDKKIRAYKQMQTFE